MPLRPPSHILEDKSRDRLHTIFTNMGWVVEDLNRDYGEDLLIRIFDHGSTTPLSFFVQAKATDHIDRYLSKSGKSIRFPIDTDHIKHWNKFWEPVILTLWDAKADVTYWESIQTFLEEHDKIGLKKNTVNIEIPTDNVLNEEGIKRIVVRTRSRFSRFERERDGAQVLIDLLEDMLNVKIEYEPQFGTLFITNSDGSVKFIAFGRCAETITGIAAKLGITTKEALDQSLDTYALFLNYAQKNSSFKITDSAGNIKHSYESFEVMQRAFTRDTELNEYGK
jgi:hypothetical protein